ncbi:MAG: hypothetical protein IJ740_11600 [Ruminococcus sp.]|nr:hypothetical protein [Ruminococcus sp.]
MKSKKERLKEQSLKQLEQKKKDIEEENLEREQANSDEAFSLSSVRLLKKEPIFCLILKLLSALVYMYSCFFYGGVTIIGILSGQVNDVEHKYAFFMLSGVVLALAALILLFFKKYIISFVINIIATVLYMKTAVFLVETVKKRLEDNYITDAELLDLDKTYMLRYYPELAFLALGFVLLVINLIRRYLKYRKLRSERDNAPVKSIIDD